MRLRILIVILIFYLLIAIPYLVMALTPDPGYVFGGLLMNPLDGNSYLAKMRQGWSGEWRFVLPYTAEPGEGAYLFLFYLFLGHLARWLGLPLLWVFHLARLLAAGLMLWALWRFLVVVNPRGRWPVLVFAVACLGLGMGWLGLPFGAVTADFVVPEAYPFLSAYVNPHFPLGLAMLLWLLTLPGEGALASSARTHWISQRVSVLLVAFLLSVISPFGVVVALMVIAGLAAWELIERWTARPARAQAPARLEAWIWRGALVLLGGGPFLAYDFWVARANPELASWNAQNLTVSPPLWDVVLSLSPALMIALPGAWWAVRRGLRSALPLLVWAGLGLVLIYAPFDLQRRFMMGLFLPFIGLAGLGLDSLADRSGKLARLAPVLLVLLSLPTTLLVLLAGFANAQARDAWLYLRRDEAQTLEWMAANLPPRALVLAAPESGMFIPAYTAQRVIYGHPFETANAEVEQAAVSQFFQTGQAGAQSAAAFLEQRKVAYIFYGPREKALGALPEGINIQPVYSSGNVTLYQVMTGQ